MTPPAGFVKNALVVWLWTIVSVTSKTTKIPIAVIPMRSLFPPPARLLRAMLALVLFGAVSLHAEDIIVTGCVGSTFNQCPPSCPDKLGTMTLISAFSTAAPAGTNRSKTMFGITNTASWAVTPTLGSSPGVYRVYVSQGTTYNCPTDLHVKLVASSGCTLADTNYVGQTEIDTAAFQRDASLNVWTPVAVITNNSRTPTITFSYASGSSNRWYMDEVRFENILGSTATPAKITSILYGNPLTIAGTGPASHPFALVSSTNAAKALSQWTPVQTNTDNTGSFSFSVVPDTAKASFFRVITQ